MPLFAAFHNITAADHQAQFNALVPQGYRPISLNVSGIPTDTRYASVWVQRPGPLFVAMHEVSAAYYQAQLDELLPQGYAPSLLSVTGPFESAIFTALFEQGVSSDWYARHGLISGAVTDPATIEHQNQRAQDLGYIPIALVPYGTAAHRRYAGIWRRNVPRVAWTWWMADPDFYQTVFGAAVRGGLRAGWVATGVDGSLLSVFRDDAIGEWWARHGLDAGQHQEEFDARKANGAMPILVQAGGAGRLTRYASIFARQEDPLPRVWNVRGTGASLTAALDTAVRAFMTEHGIRAGTIAVANGGFTLLERAYTWAEGDYPIALPGTMFRIASVAKMFTAACVARLVAAGRLAWTTEVFPFLGIPSGTPRRLSSRITVQQLVLRTSGLRRDFDGGHDLRSVAEELGITTTPSREEMVRYIAGQPLSYAPGTGNEYSNVAFSVLTSVVERASGLSLTDSLKREFLFPMGIADLFVGTTRHVPMPGEVASYDDAGMGLSLLRPRTKEWEPAAYGGTFVLENSEGSGGLVTSAATIARFAANHPTWNRDERFLDGRETGRRYGRLAGTASGVGARDDGFDWAFLFNRAVSDAQLDRMANLLDAFLNVSGATLLRRRLRPFEP